MVKTWIPIFLLAFELNGFSQMKEKTDLLIINARIYCVDKDFTITDGVAIKDGKFIRTGKTGDLLKLFSPEKIIDAKGQFIYPGFIDAHSHFYGYSMGLQQVDLTGTTSFGEVLERLTLHQKDLPGKWLTGRGWDQNLWKKKEFPDRRKLDELFPDRPVVLTRIDGHVVLANGTALSAGGITTSAWGNKQEIEALNGWETGILSENAADKMRKTIPSPSPDIIQTLLRKAQDNCFAAGLTRVSDAGLEYDKVKLIDSLQKAGVLKIRIYAMLEPTVGNIRNFVVKGKYLTPELSVRSLKLYIDGSLGSRTALLKKSYADDPSKTGILVTPVDSVREICSIALDNGYQVNTHAIGDSAVNIILNIYKDFLKGQNDLRWRVEHSQVVDPADLHYYRDYSIIPSVQTTHATSDMRWAGERLGPERVKSAYAYKSLLEQNGWIINGTDFPIEKIDPILTFYAATARKDINGYPDGGFQTENSLSREEALRSITIWAAKGCFEETASGSIEAGKQADFVILDKDIMEIPLSEIPSVMVLKTFVGGIEVFGRK